MRNQNKLKGLTVEVREGNINIALKKFKKKVDDSGKLVDLIARQFYEKPTTTKKRKASAAKARWQKKLREQELPKKMY